MTQRNVTRTPDIRAQLPSGEAAGGGLPHRAVCGGEPVDTSLAPPERLPVGLGRLSAGRRRNPRTRRGGTRGRALLSRHDPTSGPGRRHPSQLFAEG
ncbi:hypothetical protein [Actinopolyspora mortivallis]|uniref:hypothetical protein n=1 Tax=Actinopolyspora mortivallis TaxID=33906 RepID=UPI0011B1E84F|nr:hypothetical protein [Actinopolyspora mortivallis]